MENYKFLLATDYSEAVMNAERYAVQIAKETNSTLILLHVYSIPVTFPSEAIEYVKSNEKIRQFEKKRIEQHRDELFRSLNISPEKLPCECIVREGSAGNQIYKEAEESHADFIIVGTHGVSGFRETFLGSHSWDVIRKARVPVFAIPKDALFTGIKNIVFGTTYRKGEFSILDFLIHFAKQFDAKLTLLHVTNYVLSKDFEREMFEKFRSDVKGKFSYSRLEVKLLVNDAVAERLNLYCSDNKTDLLIMTVPKASLFEKIFLPNLSTTRKMSFHTQVPLLAIPDSYHVEHAEKIIHSSDMGC
ncbi:MAG: universal stress protein [Bacteroidetes bacterium]|nr:universal stress protein [Bacteroidota bacterium]